jgi:predicted DNA-binding transcriptional regulator AlpA
MADQTDFYNSAAPADVAALTSSAVASRPAAGPLPEDWTWASTAELCAWLGIDVRTMYYWRSKRMAPVGHQIAREIRYRRSDIEVWLKSRQTESA